MTEVLIGFDSAWTDNAKAPGAVAGYRFGLGGYIPTASRIC